MTIRNHIIIISILFMPSCIGQKEEEVTITKDYIINPNWDEMDNALVIHRMKVTDSGSINLQNVSPSWLLRNLEKDTSFSFVTNVKYNGENYSNRKVYFNRKNEFSWSKLNDINSEQGTLGELQRDTWYLLAGLSDIKTLYYLYMDNLDSLHSFKIPASYWTNY